MSGRCPKPGCGAMKLIAKPCTDFDCPQDWTVKRLTAAGCRILGPDEIDPVTVERCAEVAESLAEDRKTKEQEIGGWPSTATPFANHFWCEEIATAIRSLTGEGR